VIDGSQGFGGAGNDSGIKPKKQTTKRTHDGGFYDVLVNAHEVFPV
jgi:hypothetical protein